MVHVATTSDLPGGGVKRFEGETHGSSVSIFVGDTAPGGGPDLHRHPYDETFVIERGSATFTVGGDTLEGTAGMIVVVPAATPHRFVAGADGMRFVSVHPAARMVQEECDVP